MSAAESIEKLVLSEIDKRFPDTVAFLGDLIRQPSTLGNERGAQELMFSRLRDIGLAPEIWDLDISALRDHPLYGPLDLPYTGRPNVTVTWPASASGGRSLILNGHIDVVSPEPRSIWSRDPWEPWISGEWLYGRGSTDMKGGMVAALLAVEAVRAASIGLRAPLIFQSVIEEECTGNGTLACCLRGMRADGALVAEPYPCAMATVGIIWFRISIAGQGSHTANADVSVNAIEKAFPVLASLREMEADLNDAPRNNVFAELAHPFNLNVGTIRGGDWPSTVPSECNIECRLGFGPGLRVEDAQARVREAVERAARQDLWLSTHLPRVEFFGFRAEPSVNPGGGPLVRMLTDCHREITHEPLKLITTSASADHRFFLNQIGIDATTYGPVGEQIHAADERVLLPSIKQAAKTIALFILRWCGTESS